jgi:hypothetical protein
MIFSGGIAQGEGGLRSDVNSSIPTFNLARADAFRLVATMETTVSAGGTKYSTCDVLFPGITSGQAKASSISKYATGDAKLPPT